MIWAVFLAASCLLGGVSAGVLDARARARQGIPGAWVYADPTRRSGSGINSQGQLKQVTTCTLSDPGDSKRIIITIAGQNVQILTGTGGDAASLGALLAAAINADPVARGVCVATFATTTLTLTGVWPGAAFDVSIASDPDSALSSLSTGTAAAGASAVAPGVALIATGNNTNGGPSGLPNTESERLVCAPSTAIFSAQVITATIVNGVATTRAVRVYEVRGPGERVILLETVYAGSATEATEATNLAAAVELAAPANTVAAAVAASITVTFTAEVKGMEILVEIEQVNAGDITFANTVGPSIATSLARAFVGISEFPRDTEAATLSSTSGQWPANGGVRYGIRGCIWVSNSEGTGPVQGGTVYVELAPGATAGQLYAASSATRVALGRHRAVWERDGIVSSDNLAAVRLEA